MEYTSTVNLFHAGSKAARFTKQRAVKLKYCTVTNSRNTTSHFQNFSGVFQEQRSFQDFPGLEILSDKFKDFARSV